MTPRFFGPPEPAGPPAQGLEEGPGALWAAEEEERALAMEFAAGWNDCELLLLRPDLQWGSLGEGEGGHSAPPAQLPGTSQPEAVPGIRADPDQVAVLTDRPARRRESGGGQLSSRSTGAAVQLTDRARDGGRPGSGKRLRHAASSLDASAAAAARELRVRRLAAAKAAEQVRWDSDAGAVMHAQKNSPTFPYSDLSLFLPPHLLIPLPQFALEPGADVLLPGHSAPSRTFYVARA